MKRRLIKLLVFISLSTTIYLGYNYSNTNINANTNDIKSNQNTIQQNDLMPVEKQEPDNIKEDNIIVEEEEIDIDKIKEDVLSFLGNESEYISLYYYDINSGKSFDINKDVRYRSASTSKLFLVLCLYDYVHNNKVDINENIYYISSDYEGGTGIMQGMDLSRPYSLKELADYCIIHSDNIAFNMLLRRLGYSNVISYYENIIGTNIEGIITMSAEDGYKLLKKLYDNRENNPLYEDLVNNLKDTDFKNRIEEHLPIYSVAHKIGSYDSYVHDIGIVYCDNPYILTIFTNGLSYAEDKIGDISKIIYDYIK